jgi:hypothetical protein
MTSLLSSFFKKSTDDDKKIIISTNSKFNRSLIDLETDEEEEEEDEDEDEDDNSEDLEDEKPDNFVNYIDKTCTQQYAKNAEFTQIIWTGISFLESWEVNRNVNSEHVVKIAYSMRDDYTKFKQFIFYDPIHIGKKETDNKYYVLDGQHRLDACNYFIKKNKYPIQKIPAIIWYVKNDNDFVELFARINSRLPIDKVKLAQVKILEIIDGMSNMYSSKIWAEKCPRMNKARFIEKLRNADVFTKKTSDEILKLIFRKNKEIRKLPRTERVHIKPLPSVKSHSTADDMDFFLGLDKKMSWINEL